MISAGKVRPAYPCLIIIVHILRFGGNTPFFMKYVIRFQCTGQSSESNCTALQVKFDAFKVYVCFCACLHIYICVYTCLNDLEIEFIWWFYKEFYPNDFYFPVCINVFLTVLRQFSLLRQHPPAKLGTLHKSPFAWISQMSVQIVYIKSLMVYKLWHYGFSSISSGH